MQLIRWIREQSLRQTVGQRAEYNREITEEARLARQLSIFNQQWAVICRDAPYYRSLTQDRNLPDQFRCWTEVIEMVPVANRALVQGNLERMTRQSRPPERFRVTGGSTAKPIQLPAWQSEYRFTNVDVWLARAWYDVTPSDKLFMVWGHSHLLGQGWKGRLNGNLRRFKDGLVGYYRFSAYDLSDQNMLAAGDALLRYHPRYVIGYSVALDRFARVNADRAAEFQRLGVKVVIGAAEAFPHQDSERLLQEIFQAPVGMEYGAVETGLIGHTTPEGGYRVFSSTYFAEAVENGPNGGKVLRVTSLYPRCFPLVRFELGDEIELPSGASGVGVTHFDRVSGRCNAYLKLSDGVHIHSEAITHCVRSVSEVMAYQAVQDSDVIRICYRASNDLAPSRQAEIRSRLCRIHPQLNQVQLQRVDQFEQTVAGKTPMILRRAA